MKNSGNTVVESLKEFIELAQQPQGCTTVRIHEDSFVAALENEGGNEDGLALAPTTRITLTFFRLDMAKPIEWVEKRPCRDSRREFLELILEAHGLVVRDGIWTEELANTIREEVFSK